MNDVQVDRRSGLIAVTTSSGVRVLDHDDLDRGALVILALLAAGTPLTRELAWTAFGYPDPPTDPE
jgi:hypothetical protein